jgi:hypothetical protein
LCSSAIFLIQRSAFIEGIVYRLPSTVYRTASSAV